MMKRDTYHVISNKDGKWTVKKASSSKNGERFSTQKDAVLKAKDYAKKGGGEVYIHSKDGMVRKKTAYPKQYKKGRPLGEAKGKIKVSEDFDEEYVS